MSARYLDDETAPDSVQTDREVFRLARRLNDMESELKRLTKRVSDLEGRERV